MLRYTFSVDTELALRNWDDNLRLLRGGALDEMAGKPYSQMIPSIVGFGVDLVRKAICEGTPTTCRNYRISCFFGEVEADIFITPTFDENSSPTGALVEICASHPCTISKRLEQVQPLVDIAKGSASLAHGVRNPLNAIKGAVTYISEIYGNDPTLAEFTGIIQEEIEKLNGFITCFLSNSSSSSKTVRVNLNDIVGKMCELMDLQAAPKGIRMECSLRQIPDVAGEPLQLEHALMNLVTNAVEAMSGGGEILCSTSMEVREGVKFVVVKISDNGPGFVHDPSALDYPRGDRTSSGRGFGLFLSREIIQSHGGRLEINSERGVGTTIIISLPAVSDDGSR